MITSANLFCGCISIVLSSDGYLFYAAVFIILGAFFDLFDGMIARILKVDGELGLQLDSLADVVSFGVAPSILVFFHLNAIEFSLLNYMAFLIAVFSAYRLAKFNIDSQQKEGFIGLPTPANALFWISIPLIQWQNIENYSWIDVSFLMELFENKMLIFSLIILLSYLLVSPIPLIALKFKNLKWKGNESKFSLLVLSLIFILCFQFAAIPLILILYLFISIIHNRFIKA